MKEFKDKITEEEIKELPLHHFEGEILVVNDEDGLDEVCEELAKQRFLGFDTETRPSFKKGRKNGVLADSKHLKQWS